MRWIAPVVGIRLDDKTIANPLTELVVGARVSLPHKHPWSRVGVVGGQRLLLDQSDDDTRPAWATVVGLDVRL